MMQCHNQQCSADDEDPHCIMPPYPSIDPARSHPVSNNTQHSSKQASKQASNRKQHKIVGLAVEMTPAVRNGAIAAY